MSVSCQYTHCKQICADANACLYDIGLFIRFAGVVTGVTWFTHYCGHNKTILTVGDLL